MLIEVQPLESFSSFVKGVRKLQRAPKSVKVAPTTAPNTGFIHASLHFWRNPTYARLQHLFSFSDIVQQPPPADTPALESPHEEPSFESEPAAPSNAELLSASTPNPPSIAEKQQPSSKTHKKQAPPPSKQTQHVPGWEFCFGKT